ncbi:DeoR/GlpR family DNA-binding transcription regulator [Lachnospiraceae bacterium ZAX-1]
MFQIERLQRIKTLLLEKKSVDVIWLSEALKVSEVTIRRDLEKLEREGYLQRTHGGAILNENFSEPFLKETDEITFQIKKISHKDRILGELSLDLIENNDVIFLSRCGSNIALADLMEAKSGVMVFTNSLEVAYAMKAARRNKVVLIGGEVDFENSTLSNERVNIPFPNVIFNKSFIGFTGADRKFGMTSNSREEAALYKELRQSSKDIVAVVESEAFDKVRLIPVCKLTDIDAMIVDNDIPKDYKELICKGGVAIHQKFDF